MRISIVTKRSLISSSPGMHDWYSCCALKNNLVEMKCLKINGKTYFHETWRTFSFSNLPHYAISERNKQVHYKRNHEIRMTCEQDISVIGKLSSKIKLFFVSKIQNENSQRQWSERVMRGIKYLHSRLWKGYKRSPANIFA